MIYFMFGFYYYFRFKEDNEISAYTYEKTLKLHEREKLLKKLNIKESIQETEVNTFRFSILSIDLLIECKNSSFKNII